MSFQDYYTIKFGIQPKDLDEDLLKDIVGGGKKDEQEVQGVGEIHLESKIHDVQDNEHSSRDSDSHDEKTDYKIEIFKDYNKFSTSVGDELYPMIWEASFLHMHQKKSMTFLKP